MNVIEKKKGTHYISIRKAKDRSHVTNITVSVKNEKQLIKKIKEIDIE